MSQKPDSAASSPFLSDVTKDRLLIVEGPFDNGFLGALFSANNRKRIQIHVTRGTANYRNDALAILASDNHDQLRWVGLARDADKNAGGAFDSLKGIMSRNAELRPGVNFGQPVKPWSRVIGDNGRSSSYVVFPDGTSQGEIETWIWQSLIGRPEATCVDSFVKCLIDQNIELKRESKTRVHAFIAATDDPETPLNAAARAATIPIDSPHFRPFLDLIPDDGEEL